MNTPGSEPMPGLCGLAGTSTKAWHSPVTTNPAPVHADLLAGDNLSHSKGLVTALQGPGREVAEVTVLIADKKRKRQEVRKINERRRS